MQQHGGLPDQRVAVQRSLDLGYDGWMHDFGEYTARDVVAHDGRTGWELHNAYPALSARAAHEFLNYILRPPVAAAIADKTGYGTPNQAALPLTASISFCSPVSGTAVPPRRSPARLRVTSSISVPDSVRDPLAYYRNNTVNTRALLEACAAHGLTQFVFSSTAAVFGNPVSDMIDEEHPKNPINPYGASKLMVERCGVPELAPEAAEARLRLSRSLRAVVPDVPLLFPAR